MKLSTRRGALQSAALKYLQKTGQLVDREQVAVEMFTTIRAFRDALLGLPDAVAPLLVGVDDVREMRRLLNQHLKATMEHAVTDILK